MSLSDSANLCVDDTKESGKAFWTLVNFNSSPAVISLSNRVNGLLWAGLALNVRRTMVAEDGLEPPTSSL
mgnify:FL=1